MKKMPKYIWLLMNHDDDVVGFAFEDATFIHGVKRAVRYDLAHEKPEKVYSSGYEQLDMFGDS